MVRLTKTLKLSNKDEKKASAYLAAEITRASLKVASLYTFNVDDIKVLADFLLDNYLNQNQIY